MAITPNAFGEAVCEEFGLDPHSVKKVIVISEAQKMDVLIIESWDTERLKSIIKRFTILPKED